MLVQVAEHRLLPAAEGMVGQRHRDRHVHAHHAHVDAVDEVARRVAVAGEHRDAVAVLVVHGEAQRLLVGLRAHGREDRAEDLLLVDRHVLGDVVEQARADEVAVLVALHLEAAAVDGERRALLHALVDEAEDPLPRLGGDHGAVVDVVAGGVGADLERLDLGDQLLDQRVGGLLADGHRHRDRHATLAGGAVARAHQRVGGLVEVRVGHDDHVVLGAAEALHALAGRGAARIDVMRDRGGAHEAHAADVLMVEDRVHRRLVAVDDLQDAVGQPRLGHQLGEHQGHGGVALGRLQDEGVAAHDRRAELPHRDHGGEVEGRDARGHAQRLAHRVDVDAGAGAVGELALQQVRGADAELGHLQPADHVALGVGDGLAMLAAQGLGQLVHVAVQELHELHQHARAALRVHRGPGGLGGLGGLHRGVDLLGGGERRLGLHLARRGVHHVREAPGGSLDVLAVDPVGELGDHRVFPPAFVALSSVGRHPPRNFTQGNGRISTLDVHSCTMAA